MRVATPISRASIYDIRVIYNINVVKDSESSLEGYGGDSINLVPIAF